MDNTYGHLQPQALDVEKAVLGALMIDKDAYAIVCEMLYPESFYEPRNQMVYAAIRDLSMAEKPVDMLTVADRLAKEGHIDEVGGGLHHGAHFESGFIGQHRVSRQYHRPEVSCPSADIVRECR